MLNLKQELLISRLIGVGGAFVSIFVIFSIGLDPVNIPKLYLLVPLAFLSFGISISANYKIFFKYNRSAYSILSLFIVALFGSLLVGKSPFEINFYGVSGRNTGFITYFSFALIAFTASLLSEKSSYLLILRFFILAGIINIFYSLLVVFSGKDILPWKNPYGTIIGTFGNPNFLSSYTGMAISALLCLIFVGKSSNLRTFFVICIWFLGLFVILKTNSKQGLIVTAIGFSLLIFTYLKATKNAKLLKFFIFIFSVISMLAVAAFFKLGPLVNYIYKDSLGYRIEYWKAGINMLKSSPVFGLGLDSYGGYYRTFREPSSLVSPGIDVVTDTAHNVLIDLLAGGGLLLGITYIAFQYVVLKNCFFYIRQNEEFDPIFSALFILYVCYSAQTFISINQIGLAIWGWISMGLLLGYTRSKRKNSSVQVLSNKVKPKLTQNLSAANFMISVLMFIVGLTIVLPAFFSNLNWINAGKRGNAAELISATDKWPRSSVRYMETSKVLASSGMNTEALNILKSATEFDSNNFNAWYVIYNSGVSETEKKQALLNLHRLDPLNKLYEIK